MSRNHACTGLILSFLLPIGGCDSPSSVQKSPPVKSISVPAGAEQANAWRELEPGSPVEANQTDASAAESTAELQKLREQLAKAKHDLATQQQEMLKARLEAAELKEQLRPARREYQRAIAAIDEWQETVDALVGRLLADPSPQVRRRAVATVFEYRLENEKFKARLIELCSDEEPSVRQMAGGVLWHLDPAAARRAGISIPAVAAIDIPSETQENAAPVRRRYDVSKLLNANSTAAMLADVIGQHLGGNRTDETWLLVEAEGDSLVVDARPEQHQQVAELLVAIDLAIRANGGEPFADIPKRRSDRAGFVPDFKPFDFVVRAKSSTAAPKEFPHKPRPATPDADPFGGDPFGAAEDPFGGGDAGATQDPFGFDPFAEDKK
jgi:hypothetical protein